jgi:hypothetical protein
MLVAIRRPSFRHQQISRTACGHEGATRASGVAQTRQITALRTRPRWAKTHAPLISRTALINRRPAAPLNKGWCQCGDGADGSVRKTTQLTMLVAALPSDPPRFPSAYHSGNPWEATFC